jgi:toxin ParE1/3/4
VATIELAPEVLGDFDRFFDHMMEFEAADAPARIADIIQVLSHSPLIGRPVKAGQRELVVGQGSRGYVVLYRFVESISTVFVLAVRSQRELGYQRLG